jgi:hypothetical protein
LVNKIEKFYDCNHTLKIKGVPNSSLPKVIAKTSEEKRGSFRSPERNSFRSPERGSFRTQVRDFSRSPEKENHENSPGKQFGSSQKNLFARDM